MGCDLFTFVSLRSSPVYMKQKITGCESKLRFAASAKSAHWNGKEENPVTETRVTVLLPLIRDRANQGPKDTRTPRTRTDPTDPHGPHGLMDSTVPTDPARTGKDPQRTHGLTDPRRPRTDPTQDLNRSIFLTCQAAFKRPRPPSSSPPPPMPYIYTSRWCVRNCVRVGITRGK